MRKQYLPGGFTVVELLIVIVVLGILAAIVLNVFGGVQQRARTTSAEAELQGVDKAIAALSVDTGKWPNGCAIGLNSNPEVFIQLADAGLAQSPTAGVIDTDCEWTAQDISNWRGPYLQTNEIIDPWNNSYVFDPDYYPWRNCDDKTEAPAVAVVVSYGPDATEYSCDDIYRIVSQ